MKVERNKLRRKAELTDRYSDVQSLSEYSKQIVLQWIPRHYGVTGNDFADHLAKKGASVEQRTRKAAHFTVPGAALRKS
ncbi:hypothetical protein TNCV_2489861 [Trichonephila clavipes]|nr:hypothetical protein TNCV_2489861 [Trichonephila clavipes]